MCKLTCVHLPVDKETTEEELDQMLDADSLAVFVSHVGADDITSEAVMSSADLPVSSQMSSSFSSEALSLIQARQQDLVSLEASISHLQQLFSDVAGLLDTQVKIDDQ